MRTEKEITEELEKKLAEFNETHSEIRRLAQYMGTLTKRRKLLAQKTVCAGEYKALLWVLNEKQEGEPKD